MNKIIKFIAFGAGQCSSVLPFILNDYDYIIFANTGWEHPLTYEWINIIEKMFSEKFIQVNTNMPEKLKNGKQHHPPICTKKFKVEPIRRKLRELGVKKAIKYLGMTYEEKNRMRENSVKWIKHKYPLIELKMTRKDCQNYLLNTVGFVPPRSGCIICKYNTNNPLIEKTKPKNHSIYNYIFNNFRENVKFKKKKGGEK